MQTTNVIEAFLPLFQALATHRVDYVLTGSVAALLYGVTDIQPGDLDVVPHTDPANLARLTAALTDLDATTEPGGGTWFTDERGEWKWRVHDLTEAERASWRWTPNYQDWQTFDRIFNTRYGNLDIVPQIAGAYSDLVQRAELMSVMGIAVAVASLEDLLARLTLPRRNKDVDRVRQLRTVQAERANERRRSADTDHV
ncbi:MAG: hypothetical protein MI924_07225 [Chloroflexales bacterium]|nr:hypothetical protein [Chloroflexales bacterium]